MRKLGRILLVRGPVKYRENEGKCRGNNLKVFLCFGTLLLYHGGTGGHERGNRIEGGGRDRFRSAEKHRALATL